MWTKNFLLAWNGPRFDKTGLTSQTAHLNPGEFMLEPKDFYFIRHGETDWNRQRIGMGQKDIPLNQRGLMQAHEAAKRLALEPISMICHSPLARARVTAQIIAEKMHVPLCEIADLIECGWGEREGQQKGKWLSDWIAGAEIPGAASFQAFLLRAVGGINLALKKPGPVLIVSHGGVFWAIKKFAQLEGTLFGPGETELKNALPVFLTAPTEKTRHWSASFLTPGDL